MTSLVYGGPDPSAPEIVEFEPPVPSRTLPLPPPGEVRVVGFEAVFLENVRSTTCTVCKLRGEGAFATAVLSEAGVWAVVFTCSEACCEIATHHLREALAARQLRQIIRSAGRWGPPPLAANPDSQSKRSRPRKSRGDQ